MENTEDKKSENPLPINAIKAIATVNHENVMRFQRFLNTGSDKIAPYVHDVELKIENITCLFDLIKENHGVAAVELIKKFKEEKLLIRNDTLVYALAICARSKDTNTKKKAYEVLNQICQSPIDFFYFVKLCETISFEISYKMNDDKFAATKSSIDITTKRPALPKSALADTKVQIKKVDLKLNLPPDDKLNEKPLQMSTRSLVTSEKVSSRQSSAGSLKPLLALRLNSGKSQNTTGKDTPLSKEGHSDVIIETSTAELFSSRKSSAASTLRSELTFLATERKNSAKSSSQVTHLPLLPTPRIGSSQSVKKIELPLISERTYSGKSLNQTPVQQVRPGSAKPVNANDGHEQVQSRRFSDSNANAMNEIQIVSPGNIHPNTNSPSLTTVEPKLSSRQPSRPPSVKSLNQVKPPSRPSSVKVVPTAVPVAVPAPTQSSVSPNIKPPTPRIERKTLQFANSIEIVSDTETTSNLSLSAVKATIVNDNTPLDTGCRVQETVLSVAELHKKHEVKMLEQPTVIQTKSINGSTGWGRAHRRAVSSWYTTKDAKTLAFLITKYQRRVNWTHKDVLKLAHPKSSDASINLILKYIAKGIDKVKEFYISLKQGPNTQDSSNTPAKDSKEVTLNAEIEPVKDEKDKKPEPTTKESEKAEATKNDPNSKLAQAEAKKKKHESNLVINKENLDYIFEYLEAANKIKHTNDEADVIKCIEKFHFHLEHIPTKFLTSKLVWFSLIEHSLPIDIILRNLNKLSNINDFNNEDTKYIDLICKKLSDKNETNNLNEFTLFNIWKAYEKGHTEKGKSKRWRVNEKLTLSLDNAFHESLSALKLNSKKKVCVLMNVWKFSRGSLYGNANINPLQAAVFMCLKHMFTEENCKIYNFTDKLNQLNFDKSEKFSKIYDQLWNQNSIGSTEYIKAIENAGNQNLDFDVFVIYTNLRLAYNVDLEKIMTEYRKKLNKPNAKLIVVSLVASLEPVCSPSDPLSLDVIGFDYDAPNIILNFISDKF